MKGRWSGSYCKDSIKAVHMNNEWDELKYILLVYKLVVDLSVAKGKLRETYHKKIYIFTKQSQQSCNA